MATRYDAVTVRAHHADDLCVMPPAPALRDRLRRQFDAIRRRAGIPGYRVRLSGPDHVGFNDGMIYPGTSFPVGTTARVARRAALERAPLRGTVKVAVVLVDFPDRQFPADAADRLRELFFSTGALRHGSVKEYFADVSGGDIELDGEIAGPFRLPRTLAEYAGTANGTQTAEPNARTMAADALVAADGQLDFTAYDNDSNGYVDAFVVVHAGSGGEETGASTDIWSHKWVLPAEQSVDATKVFGYLTIPEDAKLGVCAHELGHLLFGWPDLYDVDGTSEGIGNWCLMAGGSWGMDGERPAHPSAWCKANQGWVHVVTETSNGPVTITDVQRSRTVHRLWRDGAGGNEYFLVENRPLHGYDVSLPGAGLLIWHIDDAVDTNRDERHYKVALVQADGRKDLEQAVNRGDDGDCFPGSTHNTAFTDGSTPSSRSYAGSSTSVTVTDIPEPSDAMTVRIGVQTPAGQSDAGRLGKRLRDTRLVVKGMAGKEVTVKEVRELPADWWHTRRTRPHDGEPLAERVAALEEAVEGMATEPFIERADRPDLHAALYDEDDLAAVRAEMLAGSAAAKRYFDSLPPR